MFKKIVGFGDSWMYGDELTDPNNVITEPHARGLCDSAYRERSCFLGLIGQHYNVPTENFGIMGGSLQSAIWTLLYWLDHEPEPESCLVLHGLTNSHRFSYYNPNHIVYPNDPPWYKFIHSAWPPDSNPDFATLIKQQTVLTDSIEQRNLNYQQAVFLFDGISARRNISMCQFNIFAQHQTLDVPTLVCPEFDFKRWIDALGRPNIKSNGHPNESGHQKIAQRLINHIDHAIIAT